MQLAPGPEVMLMNIGAENIVALVAELIVLAVGRMLVLLILAEVVAGPVGSGVAPANCNPLAQQELLEPLEQREQHTAEELQTVVVPRTVEQQRTVVELQTAVGPRTVEEQHTVVEQQTVVARHTGAEQQARHTEATELVAPVVVNQQ